MLSSGWWEGRGNKAVIAIPGSAEKNQWQSPSSLHLRAERSFKEREDYLKEWAWLWPKNRKREGAEGNAVDKH